MTYSGATTVTLSPANVALKKTGTANGTVEVIGTGNVRTVKISNITGNGTLGIAIVAGTAKDRAGNAAKAAVSAKLNVDNVAPTVVVGLPSVIDTTDGPVTFVVTYAGASTITLNPANVRLIKSGTADGTVTVTGTGNSRTVTIINPTGDGSLGIALFSDTARDAAGNRAPAVGASTKFYVKHKLPADGLFAYWDFEGDSLDKAPAGTVADHGTLVGATIVAGGLGQSALKFAGPGQVMTIAASGDINERTITQRTISLWFLPTNLASTDRQVIYQEGSFVRGMNIYLENGRLVAGGWNTDKSWSGSWVSSANVVADQWNQVTFVFDSIASQMRLHLNGITPITASVPTSIMGHYFATLGSAQQGSRFSNGAGGAINVPGAFGDFSGYVDDARIYNRVLTSFEISQLASSVLTLPASSSSGRTSLASPTPSISSKAVAIAAEDTDGDGQVSLLDALKIINHVGRASRSHEGETAAIDSARMDVNGDGSVTVLDALLVINKFGREARAKRMVPNIEKVKTLSASAVDVALADGQLF